jgi:hypothetical protein
VTDDFYDRAPESQWMSDILVLLDCIDALKLKLAWTENIAEGRGEETERLRVTLHASRALRRVAEVERDALRAALVLITRGHECTIYTKGTCRSGTGRTRNAQYDSGRWCDTCIANDAMGSGT